MRAYLSLGSNQGDREDYLHRALDLIKNTRGISVTNISHIYETEPWGYENQTMFLNIAVEIETDLDPYQLLDSCQQIENALGRERQIHWGPRTIDIDILDYQDCRLLTERLTIPHPYMEEREFVLMPLREIAPDHILSSGKTVKLAKGEGTVKLFME